MARPRSVLARPGQSLNFLSFYVLCLLFILPTLAIQVAPDSPCAELCIDKSSLDVSDPTSSTTVNADITCSDSDFNTTTAGIKWVSCMTCLQNSTHTQGDESDQSWFFYNLRYQIDYCIFGYPNASDIVGSNPCQTSTACLPLKNALFTGIPTMGNGSEYDYCSVDGNILTSSSFKGCLNCISSSGETDVVTNSLIALEAGCIEQLPSIETVGLSGSIFTTGTTISVVTATSAVDASDSGSPHVATTTIVVVAVVAVLIVAAIAGFGFVCYRKRRNSAGRAAFRSPLELKTDALASMESGVSGAPGLGSGKSGGGDDKSSVGGRRTGSIGPVDWHTRFPSSEHISGPLHFHSPSSTANPEDLFDRKAASLNGSMVAPGFIGASISRPNSANSAHSSVISSLHEQQGTPGAASGPAAKKKYKQQFQQTHAGNVNTNGTTASAAGANNNGNLPAIVESPFPSPAVQGAGAVGNLNMRIHSTDFDKQTDYPMTNIVTVPGRTMTNMSSGLRRHPRLHQLKTNFGSGDSTLDTNNLNSAVSAASAGGYVSSAYETPSSATGLMSYAAGPGMSSAHSSSQSTNTPTFPSHYNYNPAIYAVSQRSSAYQHSPMCNEPQSAVSMTASPTSATAGGSIEHQLRIATRSLAAQKQALEQQQQQQSEINQKLAAANLAHNARKQGVYKGWSAMATNAQQYQQHQVHEPVQSQHASTYGSPASAAYRGDPYSASSSRPGSVNGIGSATMATRHSLPFSGDGQASSPLAGTNGTGDMSATSTAAPVSVLGGSNAVKSSAASISSRTSATPVRAGSDSLGLGIDNGLPGNAHQVRKSKSGPFYSFGRSGGSGSEGCSPVETRNIQTHFLPPPQQGRR